MERIDAVVAIMKKKGITSAELVELVKLKLRKLGLKKKIKVGHGGTLDKAAQGLMVIGLGDGTKKLKNYLKGSKAYIGTGVLGVGTDTYDGEGKIVCERPIMHIDEEKLKRVLKNYTGEIEQIPPVYSALKINGRRASDLVREGKEVIMKPRKITIYKLDLLSFDGPRFVIRVECSGGTYIRSLIHDIGKELDSCAYMSKLVRIKQGVFTEEDVIDIEKLTLENIKNKSK
jgi:tRNA pseudouridine55 synthase